MWKLLLGSHYVLLGKAGNPGISLTLPELASVNSQFVCKLFSVETVVNKLNIYWLNICVGIKIRILHKQI